MIPHPTRPCRRCGYDAPQVVCPHCREPEAGGVREPSLQGPPPRGLAAIGAGARALPMGLAVLARTSGVKRWLLPPLTLTLVFFLLSFVLIWRALANLVEPTSAGPDAGWFERIARSSFVVGVVEAGTFVAVLVLMSIVAVWTFAVVYQAIAGPFLDAIQGRIEERWYGSDPRARLAPVLAIPTTRAVWITVACGAIALVMLALFVTWSSRAAWLLVPGSIAPFWITCRRDRDYAAWLSTTLRTESRSLFVSVQASIFAGAVMLVLSWTLVLPLVGPPTFASVAGFASAITLLDIPCSRRRWSFGQRVRFVFGNFGPVLAFGLATSALFLVPFVGPLVGIPAASIGGQWLLCRLDKGLLRGADGARLPVEQARAVAPKCLDDAPHVARRDIAARRSGIEPPYPAPRRPKNEP